MKVRTIQQHEYAQKPRAIGDEYEMEDRFYIVMAKMGHVVSVDPSSPATRNLGGDPAKKYQRRDMRAKD